ncbi:MAG: hypothetical protein Q9209_004793 [Squamulea sp. 1 TL-2023]
MGPGDDRPKDAKPDEEQLTSNDTDEEVHVEGITSHTAFPEPLEEGQTNINPEGLGQSNNDGEQLPYPSVVDEESITASPSEPPATFRSRLWHRLYPSSTEPNSRHRFTGDVDKDQIVRSLDHYIVGYPKVAGFYNSDPNFRIYRKFGWLHNRVLLYLQDELRHMEYHLTKLDENTFRGGSEIILCTRQDDWQNNGPGSRRVLVGKIMEKLKEQYLHAHNIIKAKKKNRPRSSSKAKLSPSSPSQFFFRTRTQKIISGQENIHLLSASRLDTIRRMTITLIALAILLVPIGILSHLPPTHSRDQLLTTALAILIFSAFCALYTKAEGKEVFQATAVYAAMMVFFLGEVVRGDCGCGGFRRVSR